MSVSAFAGFPADGSIAHRPFGLSSIRGGVRQAIKPLKAATIVILLSGCATTQAPQIIKVPVPQPCLTADQLPQPPKANTDAELAAMNDRDLVISLATDRLEYRRYSQEAQAALVACTK